MAGFAMKGRDIASLFLLEGGGCRDENQVQMRWGKEPETRGPASM